MKQPTKYLINPWRVSADGITLEPKPEDGYEWRLGHQYGPLHCETGPAHVWYDWCSQWYINGVLHREDGPAIEWQTGRKEWWYHGKELKCQSQEEFEWFRRRMVGVQK